MPSARGRSGGRPRVGLLLNTLSYTYQNDILLGVHHELTARDVDLCCFSGGPIGDGERLGGSSIYDLIGPDSLDGLIITTSTLAHEVSHAEVQAFCRRFAPIPLCSIGYPVEGVPSLLVDNASGVREVTTHLIDTHRRSRIAFITGPGKNRESQERLAGYRAALADRGLPVAEDLVVAGDYTHRAGVEAARRLFRDGGACDAILAANDWMALGVLEALDELGVKVPRDVSVVGFDDIDEARFTTPPLTTIRQPIRALGVEAARLLLSSREGERAPAMLTLPTTVRLRHSCGCFDGAHPAPRAQPADRSGVAALGREREPLVRTVAEAMREMVAAVQAGWPSRLVDALCVDLAEGTEHQMLAALDEVLRGTASLGNIQAWHGIISLLRSRSVSYLTGAPADWLRMDAICERAHVLVSDVAERTQGRRRLQQENLLRTLQQTAAALRTALDTPTLAKALTESLPSVNIPSCYVALEQGQRLSCDAEARLVVAYDGERGSMLGDPRPLRGGDLFPADVMVPRRRSMVLEPLAFAGDMLGFCLLELGPPDGTVYEVLREQISSAVKGAQLFRTVVEEVTKREQAERARLENEMQIATRIQTGILPRIRHVAGLEIAATMLPATEVGGDYFDILPFEGGCWLGIGDVAGHGLPTGLVMLMIQSIVAATTKCRTGARPAHVWEAVNAVLYENVKTRLEQEEYATLSLIRYESSGELVFTGAHEELIIHRRATGKCETIPVTGTWAGLSPRAAQNIPEQSAVLRPGDTLVLYTDGVTEAMDAQRNQYGIERLCQEIERVGDRDVTGMRDHIVSTVRAWSHVQFDDLTVVVIRQGDRRRRAMSLMGV